MIFPAKAFCALFFTTFTLTALAQELPAPPTPPALITNKSISKSAPPIAAGKPVQFSIGNPTDDEQLLLELINRARTNAPAEALRLIALDDIQTILDGVDLELMKAQFATNPPVAPLSFNAQLINAARAHTQHLLNTATQTHDGPGPTDTLADRLETAGYQFSNAGENVYSYSPSSEVGHAAFEVDWNNEGINVNGGMQTPPGHRNSIHQSTFKEVGIGVIWGTNTVNGNTVGPMLITQDFGRPLTDTTYLTGVAYYDINTNKFYDLGEGCGGVKVTIDGLGTFAITSASGGYSIPVSPNGTYTVRFATTGIADTVKQVTLNGSNNYKLDFNPPYTIPSVATLPSITFAGVSNLYTLSTLAGATGYHAVVQKLSTYALEGAEGLLTNVTFTTFGAYGTISTAVKATGTKGFRLAHTNGVSFPALETMEFIRPVFIKTGGKIDFKSRLGVASANQVAAVEVSEDRETWTAVWSQAGNQLSGQPDSSEKTFNARSANFSNFVGKIVFVRFSFGFANAGSYFPLTGAGSDAALGWYYDDILFTNASTPDEGSITDLGADPTFRFMPPATGDYIVSAQALNGSRVFQSGTFREVTAQANPPTLTLINNATRANNTVSFQFSVSGTVTPYALDSSASPNGGWTFEPNAIFTGPTSGRYTVTVPQNGSRRFYRVRAN